MKPVTSTSRGRWVRVRCHSDQGITGQRFPAAVYRRSQMAETVYGRVIFWRGANEEMKLKKVSDQSNTHTRRLLEVWLMGGEDWPPAEVQHAEAPKPYVIDFLSLTL